MPSQSTSGAEQADITFMLLAVVAALALAFAAGSYVSLEAVSHATGGIPSEGGRGFAANFGLLISVPFAALSGFVASLYLVALFVRRAGRASSWQRIVGYTLLSPFGALLLRIVWVRLFR